MARKKKPKPIAGLVCPRCGGRNIKQVGVYVQCLSDPGEGHYEGNRWVEAESSCGYLGEREEFTSQNTIK